MEYRFKAYGHKNITAKHKNTFEFTKEKDVSIVGDCILGVRSDYQLEELKEFLDGKEKIQLVIRSGKFVEKVICTVNHEFNDGTELVVRKSNFISKRTLGYFADKACIDFERELVKLLQSGAEINIILKPVHLLC